jgi:hypothetical protein
MGWRSNEHARREREFIDEEHGRRPVGNRHQGHPATASQAKAWLLSLGGACVFGFFLILSFVIPINHNYLYIIAGIVPAALLWLLALREYFGTRAARRASRRAIEEERRAETRSLERRAAHIEREGQRIENEPPFLDPPDLPTRVFTTFGGTQQDRAVMVAWHVWELLIRGVPVIVLDFTQSGLCLELPASGGWLADAVSLPAVARRLGPDWLGPDYEPQVYRFPQDDGGLPLLAGWSANELAAMLADVGHEEPAGAEATADKYVAENICGLLGEDVSITRIYAALRWVFGHKPDDGVLTSQEQRQIRRHFTDEERRADSLSLRRLAATARSLRALDGNPEELPPAMLTCLSLASVPSAAEAALLGRVLLHAVTRTVQRSPLHGGDGPVIIMVGADEQDPGRVDRFTRACEQHGVTLRRVFGALTEQTARYLSPWCGYLRPQTQDEAERMSDAIGSEYKNKESLRTDSTTRDRSSMHTLGQTSTSSGTSTNSQVTTARLRERTVEPEELLRQPPNILRVPCLAETEPTDSQASTSADEPPDDPSLILITVPDPAMIHPDHPGPFELETPVRDMTPIVQDTDAAQAITRGRL